MELSHPWNFRSKNNFRPFNFHSCGTFAPVLKRVVERRKAVFWQMFAAVYLSGNDVMKAYIITSVGPYVFSCLLFGKSDL